MKQLNNYTKIVLAGLIIGILWISAFFLQMWDVRTNNFMDLEFFKEFLLLFATLPLFVFLVIKINKDKLNAKRYNIGLGILITFLALTIYGQGMHNAANQIRFFDDNAVTYFYDELLSHWISITGFPGVSFTLAILQLNSPVIEKLSSIDKTIIIGGGIFQGSIMGLTMLEAHSAHIGFFIGSIATIILIIKLRKKSINRYPLSYHYLFYFIFALLFLLLWAFNKGGLLEPSQIGFGKY